MSVRICPVCDRPSLFVHGTPPQVLPSPLPGATVQHLPDAVSAIYQEARMAGGAGAYTAAVMLCRQLLMHVAVEKGAADVTDEVSLRRLTFAACVDFLDASHFLPPNSRAWVEYLRSRGNEAVHRLVTMTKSDADGVLFLTEQLLRTVYDLPRRVPPTG